jgi:thiol-disulfide isomerase/thioredoxin
MKKSCLSFIALLLFFNQANAQNINDNKTETELEESLAPIFLEEYFYEKTDGEKFSFSELRGSIIFLDFWATWCKPCIQEHPNIVALEKQMHSAEFRVVTVSIDSDRNRKKWVNFVTTNNWEGINIRLEEADKENPLYKLISKTFKGKDGKTIYQVTVPQYYLVDYDLNIIKIKDVNATKTAKLIEKKLKK